MQTFDPINPPNHYDIMVTAEDRGSPDNQSFEIPELSIAWNFIKSYHSPYRQPITDYNLTTKEVVHRKSFASDFGMDVIQTPFLSLIEENGLRWKRFGQEETLQGIDDMKIKILGVVNGMVHEANSVSERKKLDILVKVHKRYTLTHEQYEAMDWAKGSRDHSPNMATLSAYMQQMLDLGITGEALWELRRFIGRMVDWEILGPEQQQEEASRESLEFKPKPASKSSVEALGKLVFHGRGGSSSMCVVCMEEMVTGCEVTSMPCSHLFHGHCIARWLSCSSHTCPVCRFDLPTED